MDPEVPGVDVLERLGGTRARVHRAVLQRSGRVVVVKHAPRDHPDHVAALQREAHVLGRVTHRSLVRLLDVVEDRDGTTLVLAHAPGGSLHDVLATRGPLPPAEVADVGARLAGALGALHDADVVHRDVAAANVLLDAELVPVLCDLDHALDPSGPPSPADGRRVGTTATTHPAVHDGAAPTAAHDLYALGCVLWEALTGAPPHGAADDPGDDEVVVAAARAARRPALATLVAVHPGLAGTVEALLRDEVTDAATAARRLEGDRLEAEAAPPPPRAQDPPPTPAHGDARDAPDPDRTPGEGHDRGAPAASAAAPDRTPARRGGTREWGPRPPAAGPGVGPGGGRWRWLAAAAALVALPLAGLALAGRTSDGPAAVTPPPVCDDVAVPAGAVLGDLDGDGCSEPLVHDAAGATVTVPDGSRYALGEPGDQLLLGDWDGDGTWTPGLHRAATGELFLFDGLAGDGALTSRPATRVGSGTPLVVDTDGDGSHEVVTTDTAATPSGRAT